MTSHFWRYKGVGSSVNEGTRFYSCLACFVTRTSSDAVLVCVLWTQEQIGFAAALGAIAAELLDLLWNVLLGRLSTEFTDAK